MLKGIAKSLAYLKAPVRTYSFLHPLKAAKWAGMFLLIRGLLRRSARKDNRGPALSARRPAGRRTR